jgi:eukaryotic-like serine/threonine-protein kinase
MDESGLFEAEGYILDQLLAEDRWGKLYRGRYLRHRRTVLFRRLPAALVDLPGAWELFEAEVRAWARLDHPGILQVLDWGCSKAGPFLVANEPSGPPLRENISVGVTPIDTVSVLRGILESVEAARRRGVLHLGLGYTCVFAGEGGEVEVGDFGLWYVAREYPGLENPDDWLLSPEQRLGSAVSASTDVYTLGLLLIALELGDEIAREAARVGAVPDGTAYSDLLSRCLEPNPRDRWICAGELGRAMGFADAEGAAFTGYRGCPVCKLKAEIESGRSRAEVTRDGSAADGAAAYRWAAVIALVFAAVTVWWLALR